MRAAVDPDSLDERAAAMEKRLREAAENIKDYDVFYFDDSDLSWVDKPEISDEERERRRERRELRRKKVHRQRRNSRILKVGGVG